MIDFDIEIVCEGGFYAFGVRITSQESSACTALDWPLAEIVEKLKSLSAKDLTHTDPQFFQPILATTPQRERVNIPKAPLRTKLDPELQLLPLRSVAAILKKIFAAKKGRWMGRSIIFDSIHTVSMMITAEQLSEDTVALEGSWYATSNHSKHKISPCFFWKSSPPLFIEGQIVRFGADEETADWSARLFNGPLFLTIADFLEINQKQVCKTAPQWDWNGEPLLLETPAVVLMVEKTRPPHLSLWVDYKLHDLKRCAHDMGEPWRHKDTEQRWESILLSEGGQKKYEGEHPVYLVSQERLGGLLSKLGNKGWRIVDEKGTVLRMDGQITIKLEEKDESIEVNGGVKIEAASCSWLEIQGALKRGEWRLPLKDNTLLLIDRPEWKEWLLDPDLTRANEGMKIKKNALMLLEKLLKASSYHQGDWLDAIIQKNSTTPREQKTAFSGQLLPYQEAGVQWLLFLQQGGLGGLLADEMGLGKTVQILAFLGAQTPSDPVLIVVPSSLVFNWEQELARFLPQSPAIVHAGNRRPLSLPTQGIIVTSYAILRQDYHLFSKEKLSIIVLDEGQTIKNSQSQIHQIVCSLHASQRIVLSGTPIENRLEELEAIFKFILPQKTFNRGLIKKETQPFILRRTKQAVQIDLPPRIEQTVWLDMSVEQKAAYDALYKFYRYGLIDNQSIPHSRMKVLEAILRLRQTCVDPLMIEKKLSSFLEASVDLSQSSKIIAIENDILSLLDSESKVLVYSQFPFFLKRLKAKLAVSQASILYLDGSVQDRGTLVKKFQEDKEAKLFLISLRAGGVGLNLTAADHVFLVDPWWNNAVEEQAIARAHRLGQKKTVFIKRYLIRQSIEEKIEKMKKQKSEISSSILEQDLNLEPTQETLSLANLLSLLE